jgi:hypothetical protein
LVKKPLSQGIASAPPRAKTTFSSWALSASARRLDDREMVLFHLVAAARFSPAVEFLAKLVFQQLIGHVIRVT